MDVLRTFPELPRFEDPKVKVTLENVLFIWSKLNPTISYRQGMHEIAAILFLALDIDICYHVQDADSTSTELFNPEFIEHDLSNLLFAVMKNAKLWYEIVPIAPASDTPIVLIFNVIFDLYLKELDRELYEHIFSFKVESQLFGLRWFRLLFAREFQISDVFLLWDAIFKDHQEFELMEWIAFSMISSLRTECNSIVTYLVLASDDQSTLEVLMKSPARHLNTILQEATFFRGKYLLHCKQPRQVQDKFGMIIKSLVSIDQSASKLTAHVLPTGSSILTELREELLNLVKKLT